MVTGRGWFQLTASRRGWLLTQGKKPQPKLFQLTASRRGWHSVRDSLIQSRYHFNSQPHEEADTTSSTVSSRPSLFQLTASRRGWLRKTDQKIHSDTFQLTASRRGWPPLSCILWNSALFQLTASRRGWPVHPPATLDATGISTHSLTKRLTANPGFDFSTHVIFQLTASRRGWQLETEICLYPELFQLTASRRGWHN